MNIEEQDKVIAHIHRNKSLIITEKKNTVKHADVVLNVYTPNAGPSAASKAAVNKALDSADTLLAKLIINTTNLIDSHVDCHMVGIWDKSLKETKDLFLLQEHVMDFKNIIADSVNDGLKASAQLFDWSALGYSYEGKTQALVFDTKIKKERNAYMFEQYSKGYVLNHSVGMRYVKLFLCINREAEEYKNEKENWDKYYPQVANKDVADAAGYFWAVTEAAIVEGSAVVKGSNPATPTLYVGAEGADKGAASGTPTPEPSDDTHKTQLGNYLF